MLNEKIYMMKLIKYTSDSSELLVNYVSGTYSSNLLVSCPQIHWTGCISMEWLVGQLNYFPHSNSTDPLAIHWNTWFAQLPATYISSVDNTVQTVEFVVWKFG